MRKIPAFRKHIGTLYTLASPQTSFGVRVWGEMNAWQTNPKGRLRGGYIYPFLHHPHPPPTPPPPQSSGEHHNNSLWARENESCYGLYPKGQPHSHDWKNLANLPIRSRHGMLIAPPEKHCNRFNVLTSLFFKQNAVSPILQNVKTETASCMKTKTKRDD